jgi:hypothetical protein
MKTYSIIQQHVRGITDLESTYAFYGGAQGDHSVSNSVEDFITAEGWLVVSPAFKDIDYHNQDEINKRVDEIIARNKAKVLELIADGTYGEKYENEVNISVVPHPIFDKPLSGLPMESYRMVLLDASDYENKPNVVQVPSGSGIIEQIENVPQYSKLTQEGLERRVKDAFNDVFGESKENTDDKI